MHIEHSIRQYKVYESIRVVQYVLMDAIIVERKSL